MNYNRNCFICGTLHDIRHGNACPYCDWIYLGYEHLLLDRLKNNEEGLDYSDENTMTVTEAKENYAKGLTVWGEPLPKVRSKVK